MANIKFLGAAGCVTGSKYALSFDDEIYLIDCGMFQGKKELRIRNREPFPIPAKDINAVIITHAHIDHTGFLPRLVKEGFNGNIYCTPATFDLIKIELLDAAKLQEEEAEFAFKNGYSKHAKPEPLFNTADALAVNPLVRCFDLETEIIISPKLKMQYRRAGHILGSAFVEMEVCENAQPKKKIVFSGDLGRENDPIIKHANRPQSADVLLIESTYGNRINTWNDVAGDLAQIVNETVNREGMLVMPAFALGRTQTLIYLFHKLISEKKIPELPIFIDSPMAISVTNLYEKYPDEHNITVTKKDNDLISIFDAPFVHLVRKKEDSKALNSRKQPAVIISASGMVTGGRILHHLIHRLPKAEDTVLFVGYQAEGSRGRTILDSDISGIKTVKIFGQQVPIKCQVRQIHGLSAHADQLELLNWLSELKAPPQKLFVTHGESDSAEGFAKIVKAQNGWGSVEIHVPQYKESIII